MRRVICGLAIWSLCIACEIEKPEGQFECVENDECPSHWFCDTDGYCYQSQDTTQPSESDTASDTDSNTDTTVDTQ